MPTLEDFMAFAPENDPDAALGQVTPLVLPALIPEGERNRLLTSVAGTMRRRDASVEAITAALRVENQVRCKPPLPDKEIEKIARSVGRYEAARSKEAPAPTRQRGVLELAHVADTRREIHESPPVGFLASPVWPADAYGMLGAEDKAGKTWLMLDLAVSVASGTPWLGRFPCDQGGVVMFLGEGGPRKMLRRLEAIATARGLAVEDLPIRACYRSPHLTKPDHLAAIGAELEAWPAKLVELDPLYLAARGASGSDLYAMGEHLSNLQEVVQRSGAALVVSTHYNKTGEGRGPKRFTGVGPGAWGRVLVSADVINRRVTDETTGETTATLEVSFMGDEIAESTITLTRRVWVDDPNDLSSPMHYAIEVTDRAHREHSVHGLRPSAMRVYGVLKEARRPLDVQRIGDRLAEQADFPLKARTIQAALSELEAAGLVRRAEHVGFGAHEWEVVP